jgi:hypothetical protein
MASACASAAPAKVPAKGPATRATRRWDGGPLSAAGLRQCCVANARLQRIGASLNLVIRTGLHGRLRGHISTNAVSRSRIGTLHSRGRIGDPPRKKCVNHLSRAGYLNLANKTQSYRARPNHPNLKRACKKGNHVCEECVASENKRRTAARASARMSALIRAPFRSESR